MKHTRLGGFVIEQNNATGKVLLWQKALNQSAADRNGVSTADYIHAIYGFLRQSKARDVLMIGCGGGTLATMLHRAGARVSIVDIDPMSFQIARDYFHMPETIACHVADGHAFLRRHAGRYDAIVLDAFAGKNTIPRQLATAKFFATVKSRLRPKNSIFLLNIMVADDHDPAPLRIASRLRRVWRDVRLLDLDGWTDRNAVAIAGKVAGLRRPRLLMRPRHGAAKLKAELKALDFRDLTA